MDRSINVPLMTHMELKHYLAGCNLTGELTQFIQYISKFFQDRLFHYLTRRGWNSHHETMY